MSFRDMVAADLDAVLNLEEFAVEVVYTPADGSGAKTIDAVVEYGEDRTADGPDGLTRLRRATLHISRAATAGIANPHPDDKVAIGATTWAVETIIGMDEAGATLAIIRTDPVRRTGQGRTNERS